MSLTLDNVFFDELEPILRRLCQVGEYNHFRDFSRFLLGRVAASDLRTRPAAGVAGNLYSLWCQFQEVPPRRARVKVFNPELSVDQWESSHTIIHIIGPDRPFLVDSITRRLTGLGLGIHDVHSRVLEVRRDAEGVLLEALATAAASPEAVLYFAIDRTSDDQELASIAEEIERVMADVAAVVDDYHAMMEKLRECRHWLENIPVEQEAEHREIVDFIDWIGNHNFTFLGFSSHVWRGDEDELQLDEAGGEYLGLLRVASELANCLPSHDSSPALQVFRDSNRPVFIGKTRVRSTVHRNNYMDAIYIKRLSPQGEILREYRFLGLYTSRIQYMNPERIPLIRNKTANIARRIGFAMDSHDGKALRHILDTYPREELFYCPEDKLLELITAIWQIKERRLVRVFLRADTFERFVTCLLYVPRDLYSSGVHERIEELLNDCLDVEQSDYVIQLTESVLVRVFFRLQVRSERCGELDQLWLQERISRIALSWKEELLELAINAWGEESGRHQAGRYQEALPLSYQEHFSPAQAIDDIHLCEGLSDERELAVSFDRPVSNGPTALRLKLLHRGAALELSDLLPILENLGFHVLGEYPYELNFDDGERVWIHDFSLRFELSADVDVPAVRQSFEEALYAIWQEATESDSFNRLILAARLDWRSVFLLRAYARYLKQLGLPLSQEFIADTLSNHVEITRNLVALFRSLFDPRLVTEEGGSQRVERLREKITASLAEVDSLSEERVVLLYLELICATRRTSFFQTAQDGQNYSYLSFKFTPCEISAAPEPCPHFEIFVYSPRFEGVHLRMGKVARGGLRWSNRYEDYRTEILGLVKTQQVKNAVIVPAGAKGGFVARRVAQMTDPEQIRKEGLECYQSFIRGLLDLTDNIVNDELVPPVNVVCRDDSDPYLVVAADKGTAAFSDYANAISDERGYWLRDAFASGGSEGYDHKAMGITARGAWIAVQRHFREWGHDIQSKPFSVVGIGDMSGDVFGNGMLRSGCIRLLAAFNHEHIFIDPDPDTAVSFAERQRLFSLPRSKWSDYDAALISAGGGVFSRKLKRIELAPQACKVLGVDSEVFTPDELIATILRAPVDLLWNGGIGTYIKATTETNAEVGDRANDGVRIDGNQLRCRVVGEGGNLGMTQRGRVEYALSGGVCNTDFIDNSGGVDCSDHEVNIKIFLNRLVAERDMTLEQRNQLLRDMTEDVAQLVLENNYQQTSAIEQAYHTLEADEFVNVLAYLERSAGLDRDLEFLPDEQALLERYRGEQVLTRPEVAVLTAYTKVGLKAQILESEVVEDDYVATIMYNAFPRQLYDRYGDRLYQHSLRRELIATQLANDIVNIMGMTFFQRQIESAGASCRDIAVAWLVVRDLFEFEERFVAVGRHDLAVEAGCQRRMRSKLMRLGRRATRWLLRNRRFSFQPKKEVANLQPLLRELGLLLVEVLPEYEHGKWRAAFDELRAAGVDEDLAHFVASADLLYFGMGVADVAMRSGQPVRRVAQFHFEVTGALSLNWFYEQILELRSQTRWQGLAREFYVDELEAMLRRIVAALLALSGSEMDPATAVAEWHRCLQSPIDRWLTRIEDLRSNASDWDATMFAIAMRDLQDLVELSERAPAFCTLPAGR